MTGRLTRRPGGAARVEAMLTEDEAAEVARALPGVPLLFNWGEGGRTAPTSLSRLAVQGTEGSSDGGS